MTISVQQEYPLRPSGSALANSPDRTPGSSFASALTEALIKGDGQGWNEPLSQQKLAALILNMQQQVNDHLFQALTEDDNREDWQGSAAGMSFPAGYSPSTQAAVAASASPYPALAAAASAGQASKIQRSPQKNDGYSAAGDLEQIIKEAADTHGVDGNLIRGVIKAESNFTNRSTSPRGAMGLMQLMPETARELGVRNAYDPRENIMGGTKYLKALLDRYRGDTKLALAAYNWGMGNVEKSSAQLPRETRDYIARVTKYYQAAKV